MVTKLKGQEVGEGIGYILAKNHMVTKLSAVAAEKAQRYILAKNHMVTKPQIS